MEDLEQKLSELLSSPDSMAQLMSMARALSGGGEDSSPGAPPPAPETPPAAAPDGGAAALDPAMLARLAGLMGRLSAPRQDKKTALISALRPYLSGPRQQKLDRALNLLQMTDAAKLALSELSGGEGLV